MKRLANIPGFSIDKVADAAGSDPDVLRLENLDTDLPVPAGAIDATRKAIGIDENNSYLPFVGYTRLRMAVAEKINLQAGAGYSLENVVITCGATTGLLNSLLAVTDPGDEVIVTDPTYAGMIHRISLAGCSPVFVRFSPSDGEWKLDHEQLKKSVTPKTRALFIMNPSMPSGAVFNYDDWEMVCRICQEYDIWLIYNASMERILYDNRELIHPCIFRGMKDRIIIIGTVSKEYRMIGWRVGWIVAPTSILNSIAKVAIYNAVTVSGFAQTGAIQALKESTEDYMKILLKWQARRDIVSEQLEDYSTIPAAGGWSQLLDVGKLGLNAKQASGLLLSKGKIAATPMTHWGKENSNQFVRLVFSNESVERLSTLRSRVNKSFN